MKTSNLINLFFILLMGATVITTSTSCESEGCTDPNAENFDADADNDDGTCILAREKFLGTYDLTENCSTGADSYTLTITASSTSDENLSLIHISEPTRPY